MSRLGPPEDLPAAASLASQRQSQGYAFSVSPHGTLRPSHSPAADVVFPTVPTATATLGDAYRARTAVDEMIGPSGATRPVWQGLLTRLGAMPADETARRWQQARRLIRDNGVTYNLHEETGADRPWTLDLLPAPFDGVEWDALAAGLAQRARLLDAVLADLYGPQELIRRGLVPAGVLLAHPGFLRPCHALAVPGGRRLHCYAADLVRDAAGQWRVVADRAQSPAGSGYALENRIVWSRTFSELYHELAPRRLAGFFATLRQTLHQLAPRRHENPRIVLLTPGPYSETYFEHSYLARYLGYSLVEGGDLTVRDDHVFMKTLGGLLPVDVIMRRQDDDYCDPLELRDDSALGVAGLVQAARSGNVVIVNALGSSVIESPALAPYLPDCCRYLLGETLLLPSVEGWYVAEEPDRTLAELDSLVVRPVAGRCEPVVPSQLSPAERARLVADLQARPHAYAVQRILPDSSIPVWHEGALSSAPWLLRTFAVVSGDSWQVMPGGLGRTGIPRGRASMAMSRGGGVKDVWVMSGPEVAPISLLRPASAPVELRRGCVDLPSRVADGLYWLGRYSERVENIARTVRSVVLRLSDADATPGGLERSALLPVLHALGAEGSNEATAVHRLVVDEDQPGGIREGLQRLRQNAFQVRDRLSNDTWRIINQLDSEFIAAVGSAQAHDLLPALDRLVTALAALAGMGSENTTRGPGWRFLDLGRRMERTLFMGELLRTTVAAPAGGLLIPALEAALEVADSSITYRSRYLANLAAPAVVDLLVTDDSNPRAIGFQLHILNDHVQHLPRDAERALPSHAERLALSTSTWVRLVDPFYLCNEDEQQQRTNLIKFLDQLSTDLSTLSDTITTQYLTHTDGTSRVRYEE